MKVHFAFFERANFPVAAALIRDLQRDTTYQPVFIKGFDYKELSGETAPLVVPDDIQVVDISGYQGAINGQSYSPQVQSLLRRLAVEMEGVSALSEGAASLLRLSGIDQVFKRYAAFENQLTEFCRRESPAIAVLPEDSDYIRGRLASVVLRKFGVKCIVVAPPYYSRFRSYPLLGERYADWYLVQGQPFAARLQAAGVPSERVKLVTHGRLDRRDQTPVSSGGYVLYALQGIAWERYIIRDLVAFAQRHPEMQIQARKHPEVAADWLSESLSGSRVLIEDEGVTLEESLSGACLILSQSSGMLEAGLQRGIPAAAVDYGWLPNALDFPTTDMGLIILQGRHALEHFLMTFADGNAPRSIVEGDVPEASSVLRSCLSEYGAKSR